MGNDQASYYDSPTPLWEQVKRLQEQADLLRERVEKLKAENAVLVLDKEAQDRTIARMAVQLDGQPFQGEE